MTIPPHIPDLGDGAPYIAGSRPSFDEWAHAILNTLIEAGDTDRRMSFVVPHSDDPERRAGRHSRAAT